MLGWTTNGTCFKIDRGRTYGVWGDLHSIFRCVDVRIHAHGVFVCRVKIRNSHFADRHDHFRNPLAEDQKWLGWLCLFVFILLFLCFRLSCEDCASGTVTSLIAMTIWEIHSLKTKIDWAGCVCLCMAQDNLIWGGSLSTSSCSRAGLAKWSAKLEAMIVC